MDVFASHLRLCRVFLLWCLAFAVIGSSAIAAAPSISTFSNLTVRPGAAPVVVAFTVGDEETSANELTVSVQSSNPAVVELAGIVPGGSGSNRNLTITPRLGAYGETRITVSVQDGESQGASQSFVFDVDLFSPEWVSFPASHITVAAFADHDNDGDLDLLLTGTNPTNSSGSRIYTNDGTGSFTPGLSLPGANYGPIAWGDYNNDGDLDLYLDANAGGAIYANNGNGSLTYHVPMPGGSSVNWADLDNDGRRDLVVVNWQIEIYRSFSSGVVPWTNLPHSFSLAVHVADLDRDSRLDLLVGTNAWRNVDGHFEMSGTGLPAHGAPIAVADYNQDGWVDVLVTFDDGTNRSTLLYRNNQDGTFGDSGVVLPTLGAATAAWGDFDNDGWLDLVMSGSAYPSTNRTTVLLRNNYGVTFADVDAKLVGVSNGSLVWGDCDNDGDLDLFATGSTNGGYYGGVARLYRNHAMTANTLPVAPTNLAATLLPENAVRLSWSSGSDVETTNAAGLTYAVSAGFAANEIWLMSPEADMNTGYRRQPGREMVGGNTEWLLGDVRKGDYVWRVQSIDASYGGSAFSAQGTFSITNARPAISQIADQRSTTNRTIYPLQGVTNISFTVADPETSAGELVVTALSSDTNAIPNGNLVLGGSGANRTLTILPSARWIAPVVITVVVADPQGLTARSSFVTAPELFTPVVTLPALRNSTVTWGDFDNDNDFDLLVTGQGDTGRIARVYENGSDVMFRDIPFNASLFARSAGAADFNNDDNLDIVFGGASAALVVYNSDAAGFAGYSTVSGPGPAASGVDLDGDGDLDIAAGTRLHENLWGGFSAFAAQPLPPLNQCWNVVWGDYDNDGDPDVFVSGVSSSYWGVAGIYRNDGAGGFTAIQVPLPQVFGPPAAAWGDFDNDGDLDFAFAAQTGQIWSGLNSTHVFRNDGDDVFTPLEAAFVGVAWPSVAWADFDKDGDLDLAISGGDDYGVYPTRVYRNNWPVANVPPQPPTNPTTAMTNRSVTLSWEHGADAETTEAGLSYNVLVMSDTGLAVPPHADEATGFRRILSHGNAAGTSLTVNDLPAGNYRWSVQSIDTSFTGSPFLAGGTFVITNRPPVVADSTATVAEDWQVWVNLTAYDPDRSPLKLTIVKPPDHGTVGTNFSSGSVVYRPSTNYFGIDSFTFKVNDGTWDSDEATVTITVTPVQDRAETRLRLSRGLSGMELHLQGEPYQRFRIEVSTDLKTWTELQEVVAAVDGTAVLTRPATGASQEFYRSVVE